MTQAAAVILPISTDDSGRGKPAAELCGWLFLIGPGLERLPLHTAGGVAAHQGLDFGDGYSVEIAHDGVL